ncbi:MAPEG family protein [Bradyrhizobium sediminis]|uniref:MAPEG family protein n=1 Tax=Bradyrhizobium sediminis TaxID=2840469 RepID=A0A975NXX0_9BRAD|nr:MAPEG family protein [Bradyrhizobium sediminis]QWG19940.1 MAPEG family protein [Bradyrhizobium sediminis]QWG22054.1 MAPEG family protein [Bradyrhizobium sediminis]
MKITPELYYTALTSAFTGIIWVPIILNRLVEMGPWKALTNPQPDVRPHADWAYRAASAHRNAIENLIVFAPLAIIVHVLESGSPLTARAALIFFVARIAHALIYTFGIPLLRTIAFVIGFACQMILFGRIVGVM